MADLKQVMTGDKGSALNLVSPTRVNTATRPPGFYKSIVLDALAVLAAALFGWLYYRYLTTGVPVWMILVSLGFLGAASVVESLLTQKAARGILVVLCETLALLIFFYQEDWRIIFVTGVAVFLLLVWGFFAGRGAAYGSVEVPFFRASHGVLAKMVTAAVIFMILAYAPQLGADGNPFLSRQNFGVLFDWAAGLVNNFYPNIKLTSSFQDFADSISAAEIKNNPAFADLNGSQQNAAVAQTASQFTEQFSATAAAPINPAEPASDAFYSFVIGFLNAWQASSSQWFTVGWAVVLFFILRGIGIIFVWLMQFVTLVVYEILLASGFMRIVETPATKETVAY